jgi:tetratricopeptide (TPR) repeat protein
MENDKSYLELVEEGIAFLNDNNRLAALASFEKALARGESPVLLSYLAYCIAIERGQIQKAVELCNEALVREPENPAHYLNLGRVYMHTGDKNEALATLRKGMSFGDYPDIRAILEKYGTRGKPVLPFLSRDNFLNKYTGMILHLLKLRKRG